MTSSSSNDLSNKYFQALITGLIKREYYGEDEFSNEMLIEQLFTESQMNNDDIKQLLQMLLTLLRKAAYYNWDIGKLNSVCERDTQLNADQRDIISRVWKTHQVKIHDILVTRSIKSSTMNSVQWRIDIKTSGRHGELNEPTAIMQLNVNNVDKSNERVQFEMNRDDVARTLEKLKTIQTTIDNISSGQMMN